MRRKARNNVSNSPVEVKWLDLPGEEIPLEDHSVDTVLLTYTLCTIPDAAKALAQMKRVLKPDGQLLFCEHGQAPDKTVHRTQNMLNPLWNMLAGGCNLNRNISQHIQEAGFSLCEHHNFYLPKTPRFAGYTYQGTARI